MHTELILQLHDDVHVFDSVKAEVTFQCYSLLFYSSKCLLWQQRHINYLKHVLLINEQSSKI